MIKPLNYICYSCLISDVYDIVENLFFKFKDNSKHYKRVEIELE